MCYCFLLYVSGQSPADLLHSDSELSVLLWVSLHDFAICEFFFFCAFGEVRPCQKAIQRVVFTLPIQLIFSRNGLFLKTEFTISPPRHLARIDLAELWSYRDLFLVLAWRDISVRYKQTVLGVLWAVIQPITTMIIFTFIFNRMAGIESGDGTPYPIFLYTGQLFWLYFSGTLTLASNSLVANANLVQKIYFPRLILPATAATTGLVNFFIALLILSGMIMHYGFVPGRVGLLTFPILLFTCIMSALGVGLFLASINVKYRDVRHALPFFISTLMYVTPVIYPVSMLDNYPWAKTAMTWLNPISGVISNARAGILGKSEFDWPVMWISLFMSGVYFLIGLRHFRSTERYFADIA